MTPLRDAAENATAGVPVVRGLDWLRQTDGILSRAETELGTYRVWTFAGARRWHWELSRGYQRFSGSAADEDLALAAAQADYEQRILSAINPDFLSALDTARAEIERLRGDGWVDGVPPSPWSKEWFIAETIHSQRVVLTALPEEYTYDFKTADDTYIMARNIKRWMPFPDSEYVSPSMSPALTAAQARIAELERAMGSIEREYVTDYAGRSYTRCTSCNVATSEGEAHHAECAWATLSPVKENDRG